MGSWRPLLKYQLCFFSLSLCPSSLNHYFWGTSEEPLGSKNTDWKPIHQTKEHKGLIHLIIKLQNLNKAISSKLLFLISQQCKKKKKKCRFLIFEFKNPPMISDFSNLSLQNCGCLLGHATCHTPWKLNMDISKSNADLQHQANWDSLTSKITLQTKSTVCDRVRIAC